MSWQVFQLTRPVCWLCILFGGLYHAAGLLEHTDITSMLLMGTSPGCTHGSCPCTPPRVSLPLLNPTPHPPTHKNLQVLLLLPMRNMALRAVQRLAELALAGAPTDSVQHRARLLEEFEVEEGFAAPQAAALARKAPEHRALFSGNTDDHFRLGVRLMRGTVKLYADFHTADVIVASPLALATKLTDPADREGADFLSSLELVVMDRADVVLMQNWEHAVTGLCFCLGVVGQG